MKTDLSIFLLLLSLISGGMPAVAQQGETKRSTEYADFNPGNNNDSHSEWIQSIEIISPALRSEVKGRIKVVFQAPGMSAAKAMCWQQPTRKAPDPWGHDVDLAPRLQLDAEGNGSFMFDADQFPNGPLTLRIMANNKATGKQDVRELQLYNTGGVKWNQGIPKSTPPAAKGMKQVFADDFDGPLSISNDGRGKRYMAHKPGGGDFSGYPFTGPESPKNPFGQKDTWLRIHASKKSDDPSDKGSSGIIAPLDADLKGFYAEAPFYMECRFTAQSAPGTWPAFWTIARAEGKAGVDELDIIEAYGGVGKGNPNSFGLYSVTSHFWGQGEGGEPLKMPFPTNKRIDMTQTGGGSSWSTTFHTYGLLVNETDIIYYLDDMEVFRHPSTEHSKRGKSFFMINYAIGGISGWKIDLEREGHASDMWVDYVRVFQAEKEKAVPDADQTAAFEAAKALSWKLAFEDDCTRDWREKWFMDGTQGRITHSRKGMDYLAGKQLENDSCHTVLWTRKKFSDDIRVEYDFTRLDTTSIGVNIIYLLATGSGKGPYKKDIAKWTRLRRVPAMKNYFDHMHTYHISYAVNGKGNPEPDYIRARRYMPETGNGLEGTGLLPEYLDTKLFIPGKPYHISVIRYGSTLFMEVTNGVDRDLFYFDTSTHPSVKAGRVGLRQMWGHDSRYANFRIYTR
ncbi:MAG: DUF1961 family protein [Bacteroidales bacterium]